MRQLSIILLFLLLITGCNEDGAEGSKSKTYKYIEIVNEESVLGDHEVKEQPEELIKAPSDSAAFVEAYRTFCIAKKIKDDMKESLGEVYSVPIDFKLLDENGDDISKSIQLTNKQKVIADIESEIFSQPNQVQGVVDNYEKEKLQDFKKNASIDSAQIESLNRYFTHEVDEFDPDQKTWHKPKSAPQYVNRNTIYLYFQSIQGMPSNLRFRVQYHSDDWLFFHKIQFSIDGKAFEYTPSDTETDSGNGGRIWEWFDLPLRSTDMRLIEALANAKDAKMKLIGDKYYDVKTITSAQITDIKRTLDLYRAMGGRIR